METEHYYRFKDGTKVSRFGREENPYAISNMPMDMVAKSHDKLFGK